MAEAGKNVIAFGSGLVLAALLVPDEEADHGRPGEDPVPRHLPGAARPARHREGLLDAAPAGGARRPRSFNASRTGSTSCPARSSVFEDPKLSRARNGNSSRGAWQRQGRLAPARGGLRARPTSPRRSGSTRRAIAYSSPCAARAISSARSAPATRMGACLSRREDESLADGGHGPGRPRLRERPPLRGPGRAAGGDPEPAAVPGERHPILLLRNPRDRPRRAPAIGQPRLRGDRRAARRRIWSARLSPQVLPDVELPPAPEDGRRERRRSPVLERPRARSGTCVSRSRRSAESRTGGSSWWTT